jgi:uncharacterized protein YqjF (DUF2071 family)
MRQHWGKLLFMHWPIDAEILRPLIPLQLSIDTFGGSAWIGIIPFTMWGIRVSFLPPIPGTSAFHELNVRTYVHHKGVPGVWFFSLDAANSLAVWGARRFYHLPYFNAEMALAEADRLIDYSSSRKDNRSAPAELRVTWEIGEPLPQTQPDSLEFFLTERYCLYSHDHSQLYRSQIFHQPWSLRKATVSSRGRNPTVREGAVVARGFESTMIQSLGISEPDGEPLLQYAESIAVGIWPLKRV